MIEIFDASGLIHPAPVNGMLRDRSCAGSRPRTLGATRVPFGQPRIDVFKASKTPHRVEDGQPEVFVGLHIRRHTPRPHCSDWMAVSTHVQGQAPCQYCGA